MSASDIEKQASVWVAREIAGLTPDERDALEVWLAASTLHKVSYLRLKGAWRRAGRLAALKRPSMRPVQQSSSKWSRLALPVFGAMVLALLYSGRTYLSTSQPETLAYATELGRTQALQLADGTRMELNTNTRVRADITSTQRVVTLESGEAYFDVAHDPQHLFVVYAGKRRITDLGTKFSVFLNGDNVRVLVREGRVRMDTRPGFSGPEPVVAESGHVVIAQDLETLVFARPDREIANNLSWRHGMLVFDQRPLAEVAEEFNRYNAKHIVVRGSARQIHIGGSFKADNVDVFVELLHQGFGLSVNDRGDRIVVTR
jgi:transmembrane sensor